MNLTISLRKFLESVAAASGLDYATCESLLNDLTAHLTSTLARGESVTIKGIGTFRIIDDEVVYAPDAELAEKINLPFAAFEAVELPDEVTEDMLETIGQPEQDKSETEEPTAEKSVEEESMVEDTVVDTPTPPPFFPPLPCDIAQPKTEETEEDNEVEQSQSIPPIPTVAASQPVDQPTLPTDTADESEQYEPAENKDKNWWKLAIAAFFAGMVCFFAGYAMGRWVEASDSAKSDPATDEITAVESIEVDAEPDTVMAPVVVETPVEKTAKTEPTVAVVTDTIGRNRFLTTMARQHYGQMEFWVYIYEENADKIANPNKLDAGTVVVIPPADKYGIDPSDPASVAKAKARAKEITARFAD